MPLSLLLLGLLVTFRNYKLLLAHRQCFPKRKRNIVQLGAECRAAVGAAFSSSPDKISAAAVEFYNACAEVRDELEAAGSPEPQPPSSPSAIAASSPPPPSPTTSFAVRNINASKT